MKDLSKADENWIKRLSGVLDVQPEKIHIFCTGDSLNIFKGDELPITKFGGVDSKKSLDYISLDNWEAGAW